MAAEELHERSLTPTKASRPRLSQIAIAVLLVVCIVTAGIAAIKNGRYGFSNEAGDSSSISGIIAETRTSGAVALEGFAEILSKISDFASQSESVPTASEEESITIPESADVVAGETHYINYDWNIVVTLPSGWKQQQGGELLFSDGQAHLALTLTGDEIPKAWQYVDAEIATGTPRYFQEQTEFATAYAVVVNGGTSYLFTATGTDRFSETEKQIITSLRAL